MLLGSTAVAAPGPSATHSANARKLHSFFIRASAEQNEGFRLRSRRAFVRQGWRQILSVASKTARNHRAVRECRRSEAHELLHRLLQIVSPPPAPISECSRRYSASAFDPSCPEWPWRAASRRHSTPLSGSGAYLSRAWAEPRPDQACSPHLASLPFGALWLLAYYCGPIASSASCVAAIHVASFTNFATSRKVVTRFVPRLLL
jgi:hypothetical protein